MQHHALLVNGQDKGQTLDMYLSDGRYVPIDQAELRTSTGSGPGGQHRNRAQTRVELRLPLALLRLTPEELSRVRHRLRARIVDDALVVRAGERRSQADNRRAAEERMLEVLDRALQVDPRRVSTAPTKGSRERRLESKHQQAKRKALRRAPTDDGV